MIPWQKICEEYGLDPNSQPVHPAVEQHYRDRYAAVHGGKND